MVKLLRRLLPKGEDFFSLLIQQSEICIEVAKELRAFVTKYDKLTEAQRQRIAHKVKDIEHKGDKLSHEIVDKLETSFITPLDKEDIHQIVGLLDDIVDLTNTLVQRFLLLNIESVDEHIHKFAEIIEAMMGELHNTFVGLPELKNMRKRYITIHSLENKADEVFHDALTELFKTPKDPIHVIKYKEIYELLEGIPDKCHVLILVIESVVVKHG